MITKVRKSSEDGGVILVTLGLTAAMGITLASYLKLVEMQNRSVVRSQLWNAAMPAAEAGIEEALTHLNFVGDDNRAINGWSLSGGNYTFERTLGESRYVVSITGSNQPAITSIGYVQDAFNQAEVKRTVFVTTSRFGSGMRGIIAKDNITMNGNCRIDSFDSENPALSTNGRYDGAKANDNGYAGSVYGNVNTGNAKIYGCVGTGPNGSVTGNVGDFGWHLSSNGIQPGHYANDLNLTLPDVEPPFSGGGFTPLNNQSVTVTNYTYLETQTTSTIYPNPEPDGGVTTSIQTVTTVTKPNSWSGTLTTNTAPTSSTTYPAAGTYIGNVTTRTVVTGKGKKATTTTYYDYNGISGYSYQTTTYTYNTVTTNTSTSTSTYSYVTDTGNYQVSSLSMSGQSKYLVRGDTVLYVTGGFSMSGQSQIIILPGASLKVYVEGSVSLSGNGIMNLNQDAATFGVYGLPSCTSLSLSGNAAFTGIIYAPQAHASFNGGGNNGAQKPGMKGMCVI